MSLTAQLDRAFSLLTVTLNAVGTLGIIFLMVLINADVAGRAVFNAPIRGVPELVSLSIVSIVFLQAGYMARSGRMISSDGVIERLRQSAPRLGRILDLVFHGVGAALFLALFTASLSPFVEAWEQDLFLGAIGDFVVPIWPTKLIVLTGSATLTAQYAVSVYAVLRHYLLGHEADL